jgi:hypothetical protein
MSFTGQGQIEVDLHQDNVRKAVVTNYEDNPFINNKSYCQL